MDTIEKATTEKTTIEKVFYSNTTKLMYESAMKFHSTGKMTDDEFKKYEILCCRPNKLENCSSAEGNNSNEQKN